MAPPFVDQLLTREECLYLAKLCERGRKFNHMAFYMRQLVNGIADAHLQLTVKEMDLLCISHKNLVDPLRTTWRAIRDQINDQRSRGNLNHLFYAERYMLHIQNKIRDVCADFTDVLQNRLARPYVQDYEGYNERQAFYWRVFGDYQRYLIELRILEGDDFQSRAQNTIQTYDVARSFAEHLDVTHPTKLGVILNFSIFYYEDINRPRDAFDMARKAYEAAADELVRNYGNGPYPNNGTTVMMKLIRDKLLTWDSEVPRRFEKVNWRSDFFKVSKPDRRLARVKTLCHLLF